jgi:Domain of unknown function DUF11
MKRKTLAIVIATAAFAVPATAQAADTDIAGTAIACSATEVQPGGTYTCTVDYANLGPNPIVPADGHRIVIFDSGYSDVAQVTSPTGACALDGASPHCDFASIAPGAAVQMTATLVAGENASGFTDTALFESIEATDTNHANDRLSASVRIRNDVGPDTSLTKNYKKLKPKKARKAKWGLNSTVPGSSFECKIDKRKWAPCGSPAKLRKMKKLRKPGKHVFCARATAPDGATDATPACDRFKVKRAKKRP